MQNVLRKFNRSEASLIGIIDYVSEQNRHLAYDLEGNFFMDIATEKAVILIDGAKIKVKETQKKLPAVGEYTYADFLCELRFKGDIVATINFIMHDEFGQDLPFLCVGTDYYKRIKKNDRWGIPRHSLKLWKVSEIKPFYGKDSIYKIPRYDDFCLEPNNLHHEPIIDNCYNQYAPFAHQPSDYGGQWKWIKILLKHVFGSGEDQYDLGLKYLQALYLHPKRALPILVLVSEDRSTGKSTFIEFLNIVFGENMVIINPSDIGSDFNSSYTAKNIIAIEESRFDSVQATEKLKNLATQKKILVNAKHQQPYSLPFFGKLIITSNDEHKFSKVDNTEIRYWVRKVPALPKSAENHNILSDLLEEVPNFLHHLMQMPDLDFSKSRMLFTPEEIMTSALSTVKEESRSQLYKDIEMYLEELFLNSESLEAVEFTASDVKERWFSHDGRVPVSYVRKVLDTEFKFPKKGNRRYYVLDQNQEIGGKKKVGNAYRVPREFFSIGIIEPESGSIDFRSVSDYEDEPF